MGKDSEKKMKIQSQEALQVVQVVIDDADQALKDTSRKMKDSQISKIASSAEMLAVEETIESSIVGTVGTPGVITAVTLSSLLLSPVSVISGIGIGVALCIKSKKMQETKVLLYKDAIAKQNGILKALNEEKNADKARIDYLTQINSLLQGAIEDLKHDLDETPC